MPTMGMVQRMPLPPREFCVACESDKMRVS